MRVRDGAALAPPLLFEQLFDRWSQAVVVVDGRDEIVFSNPVASRLLKYEQRDLQGTSLSALMRLDRADALCKETLIKPLTHIQELAVLLKRSDGSPLAAEITLEPLALGKSGNHKILIIRELDQRLAEEGLLAGLHCINADQVRSMPERIDAMLELGLQHFGMSFAVVTSGKSDQWQVNWHKLRAPGQTFVMPSNCEDSYCGYVVNSESTLAFNDVANSFLAKEPCYGLNPLGSFLGGPIRVGDEVIGALCFGGIEARAEFTPADMRLLQVLAEWLSQEVARDRQTQGWQQRERLLQEQAVTDELTGLFNRRFLQESLQKELRLARQTGREVTVAVIDCDHFKQVNDTIGHVGGDQVLKAFSECARKRLRRPDVLGRWGGEEFVIIFPQTPVAEAMISLQRVADAVRHLSLPGDGRLPPLTLSIGVAGSRISESPDQLLIRADTAMYQAKQAGRNRIEVCRQAKH